MTDAEFINGFQTGCGQHKDATIMINIRKIGYISMRQTGQEERQMAPGPTFIESHTTRRRGESRCK